MVTNIQYKSGDENRRASVNHIAMKQWEVIFLERQGTFSSWQEAKRVRDFTTMSAAQAAARKWVQ